MASLRVLNGSQQATSTELLRNMSQFATHPMWGISQHVTRHHLFGTQSSGFTMCHFYLVHLSSSLILGEKNAFFLLYSDSRINSEGLRIAPIVTKVKPFAQYVGSAMI